MGYLYNHLATVVCGAFAAALSIAWALMVPEYPLLNFVFIMAVPIAWFLVAMCWLAQKSTDYAHSAHGEKKSSASIMTAAAAGRPASSGAGGGQVVASAEGGAGRRPDDELAAAKERLSRELDEVKDAARLKDTEIARLNKEISDLQTLVQIESLRAELANLKAIAAAGR